MRFEDFQDGHLRVHLRYRTRTISSHSESLCRFDAANQIWAQSALQFGRRCHLKTFKMTLVAIIDVRIERMCSSESPCLPNTSHQVSTQSNLPFGSRCCFKIFKMACILEQNEFSNSKSPKKGKRKVQGVPQSQTAQTPRGRGNRQIQTSTNQTNVRKALKLALSSPSEVIAVLKGLKNTRTK